MQDEYGWSEALRASHLSLSEVDLKFRELARRDQALLRRATFGILDRDSRLQEKKQPWPAFVGRAKLDHLRGLSLMLAALVRALPRRIFHDDPERIRDFYGLPSRDAAEIILSPPSGLEDAVGRADLIDTVDGFKCIEFNFGVNLGGWETSLLADLYRRIPEISQFLEREGIQLNATSTLRVLFREITRRAARGGIGGEGNLNVACAVDPAAVGEPATRELMALLERELAESLREDRLAWQGRVAACTYEELSAVRGRLYCRGMPTHVVLEMNPVGHVPASAYRLFKSGRLVLLNGPINDVLDQKRNIALLSENQESGVWSPEEREVIRKHVPWTRLLQAKKMKLHGEEVFLPDLLASERHGLVLKQGKSFGGKGVFLGRFTSASSWEELVRAALEAGDWVVQEHWDSLPYLYQYGEQGCAPHSVIWGPFVFGGTYGGVILRLQPQAVGGPVNLSRVATEGMIIEV
jgi:hypothetical protein